ncbi:MAG: DNA polymerase III subunit delta [Thermodesulfobacteriota bacterium]|nr:DNA polymerase III subunit delta [Thermodesulfobacteriota bacterium]
MNPIELNRHLENEEVLPLYYLYGDDYYLIEESIKSIKDRVISDDSNGLNYEVFYAGNNSVTDIVNAAQTIPFLSNKKCILIKEASRLSPKESERFMSYISDPSDFTCLVFIGEKANLRQKFFLQFQKSGVIVKLNHPHNRELPFWIQRLAKSFDKRISKEATTFLIDIVGNNLLQIHNEIEKVSIFTGEKRKIDVEDVQAIITELKIGSIFDLIDSVVNKNNENALKIMNKMLVSGEDQLMILGMIIRQFRLILRAKDMLQRGLTPSFIGKRLGVKNFFLKGFLEQVKKYSFDELKWTFEQFLKADLALKSSKLKKQILLERLILDLCRYKGKHSW